MKKYLFVLFMCLPVMAVGAPSVRALGGGAAVSGSTGAMATKVTPAKTGSAGVSRVGSLRARAVTTGASGGAISGSSTRFPVLLPTKSYNSVQAPRPVASGTTNVNTTEINENITNITNQITEIDGRITNITESLKDDSRFDSISTLPLSGNPGENRAWIWVEDSAE